MKKEKWIIKNLYLVVLFVVVASCVFLVNGYVGQGFFEEYSVSVTEEHPFLVEKCGLDECGFEFVAVRELVVGDKLKTIDGRRVEVVEIEEVDVSDVGGVDVYNLDTDKFSDFVLEGGVVVHNSDLTYVSQRVPIDPSKPLSQQASDLLKKVPTEKGYRSVFQVNNELVVITGNSMDNFVKVVDEFLKKNGMLSDINKMVVNDIFGEIGGGNINIPEFGLCVESIKDFNRLAHILRHFPNSETRFINAKVYIKEIGKHRNIRDQVLKELNKDIVRKNIPKSYRDDITIETLMRDLDTILVGGVPPGSGVKLYNFKKLNEAFPSIVDFTGNGAFVKNLHADYILTLKQRLSLDQTTEINFFITNGRLNTIFPSFGEPRVKTYPNFPMGIESTLNCAQKKPIIEVN